MRILFDAHHIGSGQTGNETYARELLHALRAFDHVDIVAAVQGHPRDTTLAPPVRTRRVPHNGWLRLAALSVIGRLERVDLTHSMYYQPPLAGHPTVVSIHDISYERYPQFFSGAELRKNRLLVRAASRRADMVVTLSEHARSEMIEIYEIDPDRIAVIPGGVARVFLVEPDEITVRVAGDRLRILAVGTLQPRKNLLRLLEAVTLIANHRPVLLRVIGPAGHRAADIGARLGERAVVELVGYVTEQQLAAEYRAADVFAYPSIYEGFGLPVIEAMACGTPVVTSTGGSLPEVVGDAALIVDPHDVNDMAKAIERIADDAELREKLRARGQARAAEFTWEAAARKLVGVYERVAES